MGGGRGGRIGRCVKSVGMIVGRVIIGEGYY